MVRDAQAPLATHLHGGFDKLPQLCWDSIPASSLDAQPCLTFCCMSVHVHVL